MVGTSQSFPVVNPKGRVRLAGAVTQRHEPFGSWGWTQQGDAPPFYHEGGETLGEVAQRGGRCPIPGDIRGEVGRSSEQPDLAEDVLAHGGEVGLGGFSRSLPTQTIRCSYGSTILLHLSLRFLPRIRPRSVRPPLHLPGEIPLLLRRGREQQGSSPARPARHLRPGFKVRGSAMLHRGPLPAHTCSRRVPATHTRVPRHTHVLQVCPCHAHARLHMQTHACSRRVPATHTRVPRHTHVLQVCPCHAHTRLHM